MGDVSERHRSRKTGRRLTPINCFSIKPVGGSRKARIQIMDGFEARAGERRLTGSGRASWTRQVSWPSPNFRLILFSSSAAAANIGVLVAASAVRGR